MGRLLRRFGGILEGLIITVIGLYMGLLVLFGDYWRYMNPRFKWLTGTTAALLFLMGTIAAFFPTRQPKLSRIVIFLLFVRLLTVADLGISLAPRLGMDLQPSRVSVEGTEFIRINLAELYALAERRDPAQTTAHYAVRGMVRKSEALESSGQFALVRTAVFCCLADSLFMGLRIQDNETDSLTDGEWVEVYGTLRPLPHKLPDPGLPPVGIHMTILCDSHALIPSKIVRIKEPEVPFIFEFKDREPYAF